MCVICFLVLSMCKMTQTPLYPTVLTNSNPIYIHLKWCCACYVQASRANFDKIAQITAIAKDSVFDRISCVRHSTLYKRNCSIDHTPHHIHSINWITKETGKKKTSDTFRQYEPGSRYTVRTSRVSSMNEQMKKKN